MVLHEIIHWTGRKNRLNRLNISLPWEREEMIAQVGMFELAKALGLEHLNQYAHNVFFYLRHLSDMDFEDIEEEVNKSLNYLLLKQIKELKLA